MHSTSVNSCKRFSLFPFFREFHNKPGSSLLPSAGEGRRSPTVFKAFLLDLCKYMQMNLTAHRLNSSMSFGSLLNFFLFFIHLFSWHFGIFIVHIHRVKCNWMHGKRNDAKKYLTFDILDKDQDIWNNNTAILLACFTFRTSSWAWVLPDVP